MTDVLDTPSKPLTRCENAKPRYSAAQLAPAIGITASAIRLRMMSGRKSPVPGESPLPKTWPLKELPEEWKSKLATRRRRAGYRSDDEWISSRKPWQPGIPLSDLSEELQHAAEQLRDILAPVLRSAGENSATSSIVQTATKRYSGRRLAVPNERTLRRWIETAIDRDGGRCDFDKIELYLHGRLTRDRSVNAQDEPESCAVTSWPEACHLYSTLINNGENEAIARLSVLRLVRQSHFARDMSSDALRKAFTRKIARWTVDGELRDRRTESGRRAKFALDQKEARVLRFYRLRKDSLGMAVEALYKHPSCRTETRELIDAELSRAARERRKPNWPPSLRRAGEVPPEQEALFRSKRALREIGFGDRRGNFWINEDGVQQPLVPNTLWESDDVSINEPFQFVDSETGRSELGRQVLATIDVYSAAFLGELMIGRSKDAYRAEDIADHMRDCVIQHGLPLIWRLERGPWENNLIDGIPLDDGTRWGGLADIIKIERAHGPQSKGLIESRFNHLQRILAHESTSIGRTRGEFKNATRLVDRARNGDLNALSRFWEITAAADGVERAMTEANRSPMQRRSFGKQTVVPEELYRRATKRTCSPHELWRFCPIKRTATVRKCAVEVSVAHYPMPFRFRVNGDSDLYVPNGYRVLIAFHPGHPERGCHVFNAEEGARSIVGFGRRDLILVAPLSEDSPQVNYSRDDYPFVARKRANAQVSSEARAITASGIDCSRVSTRRDGYGNSAMRASGPARTENERARQSLDKRSEREKRGDDVIRAARSRIDEEAKMHETTLRIEKLEREAVARGDLPFL